MSNLTFTRTTIQGRAGIWLLLAALLVVKEAATVNRGPARIYLESNEDANDCGGTTSFTIFSREL